MQPQLFLIGNLKKLEELNFSLGWLNVNAGQLV